MEIEEKQRVPKTLRRKWTLMQFFSHFKWKATMHPTVWILQNFSVCQILREINFGKSRSSETCIIAILGALNLVNIGLQKAQKYINIRIQSLSMS